MSAEEFYIKTKPKLYQEQFTYSTTELCEFAEAYHKAELEKVKCERTRHNEDIFNHGYCLKCESKLKQ